MKKEVSADVLLRTAMSAAKDAASFLVKKQDSARIKVKKGVWDFALDADILAERLIKRIVRKSFPDHSFLAEESKPKNKNNNVRDSKKKNSDYIWVIDPLDGTINYANGLPLFAVSVAVLHKGIPVIALVHAPLLRETFHAVRGKGAFLNKKRIFVNEASDKNKAVLVSNPTNLCRLDSINVVNLNLTRYFGCSSIELAFVACGRFSARIKLAEKFDPFSTAAGALIVEEAGGIFSDLDGGGWKTHTVSYLASNKVSHKKLLKVLTKLKKSGLKC